MSAVVFGRRAQRRNDGQARSDERRITAMCSTFGGTMQRTPALNERDALWFRERGFSVVQSLVMLRRNTIVSVPETAAAHAPRLAAERIVRSSWRTLRGRRQAALLSSVLRLDEIAFPAPWTLHRDAFARACAATSDHAVLTHNMATEPSLLGGYALVGRTAHTAYLQRLAVHPTLRRRGLGSALVWESLAWAYARGATELYVNTEPHNEAALELYRTIGFVTVHEQLTVLERELRSPA
ncbi:MAG: GNAT family N-acetyltransferase [Actinomycetota bacterium]